MIKIRKSTTGFPFWWVHCPCWQKGEPLPHYAFYTFEEACWWVDRYFRELEESNGNHK